MNEKEIRKTLAKIESWMFMTCQGCAMPEKLIPLINEIRRLLDEDSGEDNKANLSKSGT